MLKKIRIPAVVVLIAIFLMGSLSLANTSDLFKLGKKVKDIKDNTKDKIVATVNDRKITEEQLEILSAMYEISYSRLENDSRELGFTIPKKKTKADLLEDIIEQEVFYQESISQGLSISEEEAEKIMLEQKKSIEQAMNDNTIDNKEEVKKQYKELEEYVSAIGLTMDEYWKQLIPFYQRIESIQRLKEEKLLDETEDIKADLEKQEELWKEYGKQLKSSGKYKITKC